MRRYFDIIEIGEPALSSKGKLFINCKTRKDYWISFWGEEHVTDVQEQEVPFRVSCYAKPNSKKVFRTTGATFWVNENYYLEFWSLKNKKLT